MVALKAQDADRVVAAPPASVTFYLVYGQDAGLVAERSARLAAALSDSADPFSLIRLDAATLTADPSRLADEAYAVSMFGGRRAIVVRDVGGRTLLADILAPLLRKPP
ncbi:MAG TPA: DNA polymerase III subunit delta, partial [Methylomirabilota bacterium]|nr:DNA polymerase III subunit delta [Methylomirabilota bacterium]